MFLLIVATVAFVDIQLVLIRIFDVLEFVRCVCAVVVVKNGTREILIGVLSK